MLGITSAVSAAINYIWGDDVNTDKILKNVALAKTNGQITKLLSQYIVEPVIISTHSVRDADPDVFQRLTELNTDIFASFYLQAFRILCDQYGANLNSAVNLLSTDNSIVFSDVATEADTSYLDMILNDTKYVRISTEKKDILDNILSDNRTQKDHKIGVDESLSKFEKSPLYSMLTRNIEVSVTVDEKGKNARTLVIPITIKAHIMLCGIDSLLNMLAPNKVDKSFSYRLDEYRAGAISLSELIFCGDLIKKYKDNKIRDKEGLLNVVNERSINASARVINNGIRGFEANYNMLMVTANEKVRLDKHVVGDIYKEKHKQDLLNQAHAINISVVDEDYERVIMLTKDIRGSSNVGFKQLKKRKADSGNYDELIKALMVSKPMSF